MCAVADEVNHFKKLGCRAVQVGPDEANGVARFPGVPLDARRVKNEHAFVVELADAKVVALAVAIFPEVLVNLMILVVIKKPNGQAALPTVSHFALSVNANVGAFPDACVLRKKS